MQDRLHMGSIRNGDKHHGESRFDCVSGVCEQNQGSYDCRPACLPECSCRDVVRMSDFDPYQSYCTNELLPIP